MWILLGFTFFASICYFKTRAKETSITRAIIRTYAILMKQDFPYDSNKFQILLVFVVIVISSGYEAIITGSVIRPPEVFVYENLASIIDAGYSIYFTMVHHTKALNLSTIGTRFPKYAQAFKDAGIHDKLQSGFKDRKVVSCGFHKIINLACNIINFREGPLALPVDKAVAVQLANTILVKNDDGKIGLAASFFSNLNYYNGLGYAVRSEDEHVFCALVKESIIEGPTIWTLQGYNSDDFAKNLELFLETGFVSWAYNYDNWYYDFMFRKIPWDVDAGDGLPSKLPFFGKISFIFLVWATFLTLAFGTFCYEKKIDIYRFAKKILCLSVFYLIYFSKYIYNAFSRLLRYLKIIATS